VGWCRDNDREEQGKQPFRRSNATLQSCADRPPGQLFHSLGGPWTAAREADRQALYQPFHEPRKDDRREHQQADDAEIVRLVLKRS